MWKLVPPKPYADTPQHRGVPLVVFQSRSSWFAANGLDAKSIPGLGFSAFSVGGSTFSWTA
jgi:hypothetical protein